MGTEYVSSTEVQRNIGANVDKVRNNGNTLVVTAHDRPQYVLMPYSRFVELEKREREVQQIRLERLRESEAPQ